MPGLGDLPTAVQQRILVHLLEIDTTYEDDLLNPLDPDNHSFVSDDTLPEREDDLRLPARRRMHLERLQRVNKSWYEVTSSQLWSRLSLEDATLSDLTYILETILPRHGTHIRRLEIYESGVEPITEPYGMTQYGPDTPNRAILELAERLTSIPRHKDWRTRLARVRNALIARILVETVAVEVLVVTDGLAMHHLGLGKKDNQSYNARVPLQKGYPANAALSVLPQISHRVRKLHLRLVRQERRDATEGDLADILTHFGGITFLVLDLDEDSMGNDLHAVGRAVGRADLFRILGTLRRLETLEVTGPAFKDPAFAEIKWTAPLKNLALLDISHFPPGHFGNILTTFAPTLESLEFDHVHTEMTVIDAHEDVPGGYPKLRKLDMAGPFPLRFPVQLFMESSLEHIVFTSCPKITADDTDLLLWQHRATLKFVTLEDRCALDAGRPFHQVKATMEGLAKEYGFALIDNSEPEPASDSDSDSNFEDEPRDSAERLQKTEAEITALFRSLLNRAPP
ncbi:hypothetical protein JCM10908_004765 [Rhodotorula pacifica]|uniref:uncharacterized protein n=1 Tax=Rhodotorula pacifica TaxID=1495444 RepID=UPI0031734EE6